MLSFWAGGISSFPPCAREYLGKILALSSHRGRNLPSSKEEEMSKVSEEEGNEFIYGALGWGGGLKLR